MLGCQMDNRAWGGEKLYKSKGKLGTEEGLWKEDRNAILQAVCSKESR